MLFDPRHTEVPLIPVEWAIALDYDRSISNVNAVRDRVAAAVVPLLAHQNVTVDFLHDLQNAAERGGNSYDAFGIVKQLDEAGQRTFRKRFLERDDIPLLYPDVPLLFRRLVGIPHLLVTRAVDYQSQRFKVASSGYEGAARIMYGSNKGDELASWRSPDGTYDFAGLDKDDNLVAFFRTVSLLLVDDMPASFINMPRGARGQQLLRPDETRTLGQIAELPERVDVIENLDSVDVPPRPEVDINGHPLAPGLLESVTQYVPLRNADRVLTHSDIMREILDPPIEPTD